MLYLNSRRPEILSSDVPENNHVIIQLRVFNKNIYNTYFFDFMIPKNEKNVYRKRMFRDVVGIQLNVL